MTLGAAANFGIPDLRHFATNFRALALQVLAVKFGSRTRMEGMLRRGTMGLLIGAAGCEEATDRLDPDVVADISAEVGDQRGVERSGLYQLQLQADDCGCMLDNGLHVLSLCGSVLATAVDGVVTANAEIVAADGHIVIELTGAPNTTMVGPQYQDGRFAGGAVTHLTALITRGNLVTRIEGEFDEHEDDSIDIEGTLEHRVLGRAEFESINEDLDCRESLSFTGTRWFIR